MPDRTTRVSRWLLMAVVAIGAAVLFATPAIAHAHHHPAVASAPQPASACEAAACVPVALPDCCLTVTCTPVVALERLTRPDNDGLFTIRIHYAATAAAPLHGYSPSIPRPPPRFPG